MRTKNQMHKKEAAQEGKTTTEAHADDSESLKSCDPQTHHSNSKNLLSECQYGPVKCPAYIYHQTSNNVTFILNIPVVKEITLVRCFEPQQVSQ